MKALASGVMQDFNVNNGLSRGMHIYNINYHYIRNYIEKIVGDEY